MFLNQVPLQHLWLCPFLAGLAWFFTLFALLVTWLAKGMPKYPMQSNPCVAFISDMAAFTLKPLFLVGGSITAVSFILTVCAVHFARYSHRMYGIDDVRWKKSLSIFAMISGVVASLALVLLAGMDTLRFHEEHAVLLLVCFVGLAFSAIATTIVYFDQTWNPSPFRRLRVYCILSAMTISIDFCLGVAFYSLMRSEHWKIAGILEWIMAFTGTFYIWAFIGFVS
ncbi:hypothetical protein AOQ84DRAFT_283540 [Glonium stellatum]|uniref:CWH43-like N-terminal domain-containing protein n=1 Tax=Glonium stellatum TaxID=574774 RepID=A0A8E2F9T7_9PEZI|nr:hypothetical protein AOQ84DRAFT_283540 [Glonium stellatum]